ncbi:hypothetical protein EB796_022952 [Bugula neritina]|uniref:Uncharacterized protein n=1 Tax=Bugula neritina TaxID=10212 RepID=A0A7J7IXV4_BUGNE|nr:hypothetical protein EB796_022952 [Bugula neritina]
MDYNAAYVISPTYTFIRGWEYSLVSRRACLVKAEKLRVLPFDEKMWVDEANYSAAKVLLLNRNVEEARKFFELALRKDPTNIQAWCNKGLFHSIKLEQAKAEEAREEMEKLMGQKKPMQDAAIQYAYWLFEYNRTPECQEEGLQVFEETLANEIGNPNTDHHHLYLKVLSRKAKQSQRFEYLRSILQKFVGELIILFNSPSQHEKLTVWLFLADIQRNYCCVEILRANELAGSSEFLDLANLDSWPDMKLCIQKLKRWELLGKGLEFGQPDMRSTHSRLEFGTNIAGKIYLNQWAMKYYEEYKPEIMKVYRGNKSDQNEERRSLLKKANEQFKRGEQEDAGKLYERTQQLLGERGGL